MDYSSTNNIGIVKEYYNLLQGAQIDIREIDLFDWYPAANASRSLHLVFISRQWVLW